MRFFSYCVVISRVGPSPFDHLFVNLFSGPEPWLFHSPSGKRQPAPPPGSGSRARPIVSGWHFAAQTLPDTSAKQKHASYGRRQRGKMTCCVLFQHKRLMHASSAPKTSDISPTPAPSKVKLGAWPRKSLLASATYQMNIAFLCTESANDYCSQACHLSCTLVDCTDGCRPVRVVNLIVICMVIPYVHYMLKCCMHS